MAPWLVGLAVWLAVPHPAAAPAPRPCPPGGRAAEEFVNAAGGTFTLPAADACKAVVLIFVDHECPISNGYSKEIARLCADYGPKEVVVCVVYAEADITAAEARTHAKEFGLPCPAVLDPTMTLARRVGATVKPEAAVLSPAGTLLYRGRIDDRYVDYGKRREQLTSRDLRDALDLTLAGKPVATPRTKAVGCDIDFPAGPK